MPKIIETLPERLLEETHHQLQTVGYSGALVLSSYGTADFTGTLLPWEAVILREEA